jgi:hypothetical protein
MSSRFVLVKNGPLATDSMMNRMRKGTMIPPRRARPRIAACGRLAPMSLGYSDTNATRVLFQLHFQVRVLAGYRPGLRGTFTYPEPFDRT